MRLHSMLIDSDALPLGIISHQLTFIFVQFTRLSSTLLWPSVTLECNVLCNFFCSLFYLGNCISCKSCMVMIHKQKTFLLNLNGWPLKCWKTGAYSEVIDHLINHNLAEYCLREIFSVLCCGWEVCLATCCWFVLTNMTSNLKHIAKSCLKGKAFWLQRLEQCMLIQAGCEMKIYNI